VWRRLSEVAQDALDEGAVGWRLLRPWQVRFEADLELRLPLRCECLRRQATDVKRLAYTRTQAAEALGVSRSTFDRRVLPLLETLDMPWGPQLVPVDELTRFVRERRRPARGHVQTALPGRPTAIPEELVRDIQSEHAKGKSLRRIARDLNASRRRPRTGARSGGRRRCAPFLHVRVGLRPLRLAVAARGAARADLAVHNPPVTSVDPRPGLGRSSRIMGSGFRSVTIVAT
jgi:hypothetical protein